ncbi:MAG: thiamine pyrophosphate-binding protein [Candidatus Electrothrix sp. GM3_4]|nr:thiamine pyrophosphate-binding protein [Candidatus Electrothrix sp. GM3_4]
MSAVEELWQVIKEVLEQGRKVALFIGYECAGAVSEIMRFAELLNTPIVTSWRGKGKVDPYHPLVRGVFGVGGHQSAREALADDSVGLILAVGTSLGQMATAGWNSSLLNEKLVHIHHSTVYFPRSPMARLHVCGTADIIFQELTARLTQERGEEKMKRAPAEQAVLQDELKDEKNKPDSAAPPQITLQVPDAYQDTSSPIKPQRLMYELMRRFPPETRFLIDNGTSVEWTIHYLFLRKYTNYRLVSTTPCSMGWAPGSAVGTALGNPGTPVVCIVGDASYMMYGHEISVAVAEKLPVIFIILNDSSFGAVKHRNRQIGTLDLGFALPPTDFALMAEAVGAAGYAVHTPEDFAGLDFHNICTRSGPTVLDVYIDPEEAPPIDQ